MRGPFAPLPQSGILYPVLSVKPPFAELIMSGEKWSENRSWSPSGDELDLLRHSPTGIHGLPLWIHESGGSILGCVVLAGIVPLYSQTGQPRPLRSVLHDTATIRFGHPSLDDGPGWEHCGSAADGYTRFRWILRDPLRLETPIPARGRLRLWEFKLDNDV